MGCIVQLGHTSILLKQPGPLLTKRLDVKTSLDLVVRRLTAQWLEAYGPFFSYPDNEVHGANMGPICGRQDPVGSHVGPINFAIWVELIWDWGKGEYLHATVFCGYNYYPCRYLLQRQFNQTNFRVMGNEIAWICFVSVFSKFYTFTHIYICAYTWYI